MTSRIIKLSVVLSLGCFCLALPVERFQSLERRQQVGAAVGTPGLPPVGSGPTNAADGSVIVENEVVINGLNMRFKVSAPASQLVANASAGAAGGAGVAGAGALGINVLFHGDGGQSFFDFPNQGVNNNLMGVALLSPDPQLRWGGSGPGLLRPDGSAHSAAVNQLLTNVLPTVVNFNKNQIFMEGVSGGSLLLSGFLLPTFGASLAVPGAIVGCGGLTPQVAVRGDISNMRIHWQSSVNDLAELQQSIPPAILAYEKVASDAGLSADQINKLQTADASPDGGHCEFDQKGFVSGVQLLTDNFSAIIAGNGALNGVPVANGVVGNENLFGGNGQTAAGVAGQAANNQTAAGSGGKAVKGATGVVTGQQATGKGGIQ